MEGNWGRVKPNSEEGESACLMLHGITSEDGLKEIWTEWLFGKLVVFYYKKNHEIFETVIEQRTQ